MARVCTAAAVVAGAAPRDLLLDTGCQRRASFHFQIGLLTLVVRQRQKVPARLFAGQEQLPIDDDGYGAAVEYPGKQPPLRPGERLGAFFGDGGVLSQASFVSLPSRGAAPMVLHTQSRGSGPEQPTSANPSASSYFAA